MRGGSPPFPRIVLMIRRIDLRGAVSSGPGSVDYREAVPRADFDVEAAVPAVHAICENVRLRGLEAIYELSAKHDGVEQSDIRVPRDALSAALDGLDPDIRAGLEARGIILEDSATGTRWKRK